MLVTATFLLACDGVLYLSFVRKRNLLPKQLETAPSFGSLLQSQMGKDYD